MIDVVAKSQAEMEHLRATGVNIGPNGSFALEKSVHEWLMAVGEIHIIHGPEGVPEPRHVDGAAGCFLMGVTHVRPPRSQSLASRQG